MFKMSLRFPYLIYLSLASMLVGVIIAPVFRDLPQQAGMDAMAHQVPHGTLEVPAVGAPQVDIAVEKDPMDGWNVTITTMNFSFTPELVNGEHIDNTGHAHLYVGGLKIARLYGPHFHLPDLPEGAHDISVTLSSNSHDYYVVGGTVIEARTTITQQAPQMDMP